jgi:hypothetical protein
VNVARGPTSPPDDPRLPLPLAEIRRLVMKKHASLVRRIADTGRVDEDDVFQEVLLGLLARHGYDERRGWAPSTYVVRVTRCVLINLLHRIRSDTGDEQGLREELGAPVYVDSTWRGEPGRDAVRATFEGDAATHAAERSGGAEAHEAREWMREQVVAEWVEVLGKDASEGDVDALRLFAAGWTAHEVAEATSTDRPGSPTWRAHRRRLRALRLRVLRPAGAGTGGP